MRYEVMVTDEAWQQIEAASAWIADQSPQAAVRWLDKMMEAVHTLASYPKRCSIAPESSYCAKEIHQLLVGKGRSQYRVLFRIHTKPNHVTVIGIKHSFRERQ